MASSSAAYPSSTSTICTVSQVSRTTGLDQALTGLPSVATSAITNTSGKMKTLRLSILYFQCTNK